MNTYDIDLDFDFGYSSDVWRWVNLVVVCLACAGIMGTMFLWNAGNITLRQHLIISGMCIVVLIVNAAVEVFLSKSFGGHDIHLWQRSRPEPRGFDVVAPKDKPHEK